jgi:hypothetical protein
LSLALRALTAGKAFSGVAKNSVHKPTRAIVRPAGDFARFYGMLIDGLQISYVKRFGYNQVLPVPEAEKADDRG